MDEVRFRNALDSNFVFYNRNNMIERLSDITTSSTKIKTRSRTQIENKETTKSS